MTDRPGWQGHRRPSHKRVFSLLGYSPSSTVLAESLRDGLYLALVESQDGLQADGILLRFVDGQWSRLDENGSRDVARAVGCDPSRAGLTISVAVNEMVFEEAVSAGGWWAFVAAVNDHHLPENAIRLPGPADADELGLNAGEANPSLGEANSNADDNPDADETGSDTSEANLEAGETGPGTDETGSDTDEDSPAAEVSRSDVCDLTAAPVHLSPLTGPVI